VKVFKIWKLWRLFAVKNGGVAADCRIFVMESSFVRAV
jgi:hypothetical protein